MQDYQSGRLVCEVKCAVKKDDKDYLNEIREKVEGQISTRERVMRVEVIMNSNEMMVQSLKMQMMTPNHRRHNYHLHCTCYPKYKRG